jgi:hypothetical protein
MMRVGDSSAQADILDVLKSAARFFANASNLGGFMWKIFNAKAQRCEGAKEQGTS